MTNCVSKLQIKSTDIYYVETKHFFQTKEMINELCGGESDPCFMLEIKNKASPSPFYANLFKILN